MNIAIIGAGNGGQAIAGYLATQGHIVRLYDRNEKKIEILRKKGGITLKGKINGVGKISLCSSNIEDVIKNAKVVMITTTATAHGELAKKISHIAEENQIFVLNPGRTCGALEFRNILISQEHQKRIYIAEAQTLVYACRLEYDGCVNIIGIKDKVLLSAFPNRDTSHVISVLNQFYSCFTPAENILRTSLENIGAILHTCVMLLNIGTIERKKEFYFYRDMTERVSAFIEAVDNERVLLGQALGLNLISVRKWLKYAYSDTKGYTLCERMRNNPSYYNIKAPNSIFIRQLTEDIPTGILPMLELGKAIGLEMTLMESIVNITSCILGINFRETGRTLKNLGIMGMSKSDIINYFNQ